MHGIGQLDGDRQNFRDEKLSNGMVVERTCTVVTNGSDERDYLHGEYMKPGTVAESEGVAGAGKGAKTSWPVPEENA